MSLLNFDILFADLGMDPRSVGLNEWYRNCILSCYFRFRCTNSRLFCSNASSHDRRITGNVHTIDDNAHLAGDRCDYHKRAYLKHQIKNMFIYLNF